MQMRPARKARDVSALYVVFMGLMFGGLVGWILSSKASSAPSYRRNFSSSGPLVQSPAPENDAPSLGDLHHSKPTLVILFPSKAPTPTSATPQPSGTTASAPGPSSTGAPSTASIQAQSADRPAGDTIHTLFTSNGSPYQNFQGRIMYGTYKLVQQMPGGEKMTGFTRILHRTAPDGRVMDEIPTFRANPLQPECDNWCEFPVADRANAVQQWINAAEADPGLIKGAWLLMLETDYVWMKPMMAPGSAYDPKTRGISFAFDYINPKYPGVDTTLKAMCPECGENTIPNSGPAPVLMRFQDLKAATPYWENYTMWIETHKDAKSRLGWVREMYAWSAAVAMTKAPIDNIPPPKCPLISQPPHDLHIGAACMYHYTWGVIYKNATTQAEIWKWDKRFYTAAGDALRVPHIGMPPPWSPGIILQDGLPVSQQLHDTLADMLQQMNKAIALLPDLS